MGSVTDEVASIKYDRRMARSLRLANSEAKARLPAWIQPQLTRLVTEAPSGDEWAHELKFDGYRMHARLDRGEIRLLTRTGLDWTGKYPAIVTALRTLPARQAYLDGELCGVQPDGITSFALIQNAADRRGGADLVFFVFDLLHLDGLDLMPLPLADRKARLAALLEQTDAAIRYSDHQIGLGPAFHRHACALGLEGIVSKRQVTAQASASGSRPNASTGRSSPLSAGPNRRAAGRSSVHYCSGTTIQMVGSSTLAGSVRECVPTSSRISLRDCGPLRPTGCRSTSLRRARPASARRWCCRGSIGSGRNSSSRSSF
jgi:hypothetical protein